MGEVRGCIYCDCGERGETLSVDAFDLASNYDASSELLVSCKLLISISLFYKHFFVIVIGVSRVMSIVSTVMLATCMKVKVQHCKVEEVTFVVFIFIHLLLVRVLLVDLRFLPGVLRPVLWEVLISFFHLI